MKTAAWRADLLDDSAFANVVLHREPFTIVFSFVLAAFYGFRSVRGVRRTLRSIHGR